MSSALSHRGPGGPQIQGLLDVAFQILGEAPACISTVIFSTFGPYVLPYDC